MTPMPRSQADPATHTLSFARQIAAPPEVIFDAWTRPEQVTVWWDPSGTPLAACTIDLRPGGGFSFVHQGHGFPFTGVYREIERPTRLSFDANGAAGEVRLTAQDGGTRLEVRIVAPSAEHFANLVRFGVQDGTDGTLDNLARFAVGAA